jgi:hypothetical protein
MLDTRKYYNDWQERKKNYNEHGYEDFLVSTDDLNGISHDKIAGLIENIKEMDLKVTIGNKFSKHHYELY